MKKIILLSLSVILFFTFSFTFAYHHSKEKMPVSISTVLNKLAKQGYNDFTKVEYRHGTYKIEGYDAQGQKVKVHYNTNMNGKSASNVASHPMNMLQAIQKANAAGYETIYKIEFEHGRYEMNAINKNGKKAKLVVNPQSGQVTLKKKSWFNI